MNSVLENSHDPKWRRLPEERPMQILSAALAEFGEEGIAGAKLENIAARAGVSKGTIYLYFSSKEDLFREVVRQILVPRMRETEQSLQRGTPTEQLERFMRLHWAHFDRPGTAGWIRLVLTELYKHPDLWQFYYDEAVRASNAILSGIIERGIAAGEFRRIDPTSAVSMIKAMSLMHVLWGQLPPPVTFGSTLSPADRKAAAIEAIVDFVLHALRTEPA